MSGTYSCISDPWLMERQLDQAAAVLLRRSPKWLGVEVRLDACAGGVLREDRVRGVSLHLGEHLAADMVALATGIVPEVALAHNAGLEVERASTEADA